MTAFSQMHNPAYNRGNRKDIQRRSRRRKEDGQQWTQAGFVQVDGNKFEIQCLELKFRIVPGLSGLIATCDNLVGHKFDYGTRPATIAVKLQKIACAVMMSWQPAAERYGAF